MSVNRIAHRYAKSLLDLAAERNQVEEVRADIDTFRSALQHREFVLMLQSPMIHGDRKFSVLQALFGDKISALTMEFFRICVRKGREGLLPDMAQAFIRQYRVMKRILSIRLVSASPLEAGVKEEIGQRIRRAGLAEGEIEWETSVDPALIGGFILELGDRRYDASIAHQLEKIRKEMIRQAG